MLANVIHSIMTSDIISVPLGTPLKEAISRMSARQISCIIINEQAKPVGILTERDILKIAAAHKELDALKVEDVMTAPVATVSSNMDIYEAAIYLEKHNFRRIVIVDDAGNLLGLVTQTDLKNHLGAAYYVKLKTVKNIMSANVVISDHTESLLNIIQKMNKEDTTCVVICENNSPLGMITERDVTRIMATAKEPANLLAKDFVKSPIISISSKASIYDATNLMKKKEIRRLAVLDENQKLVGIVAESDLVKHLEIDYLDFLKNIVEKDRAYVNTIQEGIFECTPNANGIFTWINQSGAEVLGYKSPDQVIGRKLKDIFVDIHELEKLIELVHAKAKTQNFSAKLKKLSGREFYGEGSFYLVKDDDGKIACLEGTLRDITSRKRMEEKISRHSAELEQKVKERTAEIRRQNRELEKINFKLHQLSIQDGLTGIYNFRYFSQLLEMEFKKSIRYKLPLSCMIIDVDDFKIINDRFGHTAGDLALIKTAQLLKQMVRTTDIVARYGGDEFTIILPNTDLNHAYMVALKIQERFRDYQLVKGAMRIGKISISIGISNFPGRNIKKHQHLIEHADKAMYMAKENGKDGIYPCC